MRVVPRGVAILTLVLVVAPVSRGAAGRPASSIYCRDPGRITKHGDWVSIHVPQFSAGPGKISTIAVEETNPLNLFVTNGVVLLRSRDGGCTWAETFTVAEDATAPDVLTATGAQIVDVEAASDGSVYMAVQRAGGLPRPYVLRSADAGDHWSGGELAGAVGVLNDLAAAPSDPATVYALVERRQSAADAAVRSGQELWATNDGGDAWERRSALGDGAAVVAGDDEVGTVTVDFRGLDVDTSDADAVWTYGTTGASRSIDGGRSFRRVTFGGIGALDVHHLAGDAGRIFAFSSEDPLGHVSDDGGETFTTVEAPGIVDSVGHGDVPAEAMLGAEGRVYLLGAPRGPARVRTLYDVSPSDGRAITGITGASPRTVFGHTDRTIELNPLAGVGLSPPAPPPPVIGVPPASDRAGPVEDEASRLDAADATGFPKGHVSPRRSRIELAPGEKRAVTYTVELPPSPTPLDVYFLVDVSSSMASAIEGVRESMQGIVTRLSELGLDVNFGVGMYRTFDDPPAYALVRDILPAGPGLSAALHSLEAAGGGNETQLYALLRSVGGEGASDGFHFRSGSLRVAVHATDEALSTGGHHPRIGDVVDALRADGVRQVGLAIQPPSGAGDAEGPEQGLVRVAAGTGARAPRRGVDCDGDGAPDIAAREPLVCEIVPERAGDAALMAGAIVQVLEAVEDRADLEVSATTPGSPTRSPVAERVMPDHFGDVDLKARNVLRFTIRYRCPSVTRPATFPVEVVLAGERGRAAEAKTVVECTVEGVPSHARVLPAAAVPPQPPPPVAPSLPARGAEPHTNPQSQVELQPLVQPQAQTQVQAAVALQLQEQPQPALARAIDRLQNRLGGEHAMTALRSGDRRRLDPARLYVGAGALTATAVLAMIMARAHAVAAVPRRRTR